MTTLENPDDLRSDFERYREYERRRKVTRVILIILLVLFALFRLMPLDWASGNISNLFGVTNIFNNGSGPGSGSGPVSSPSSSSDGGNGGGSGQEAVDGSGQINYIVGSPGPVGPAGVPGKSGARGPAGKDGTFSQVGFGQSQATIGICDDAVNVSLRSTWDKNLGTDGNFALSLIRISNVSTECNGLNLFVDLLDENGDSMLDSPLEIAAINVGSTGEIVFTSRTHPQLLSIISNQIDKFLMEVAS